MSKLYFPFLFMQGYLDLSQSCLQDASTLEFRRDQHSTGASMFLFFMIKINQKQHPFINFYVHLLKTPELIWFKVLLKCLTTYLD